MGYIALVKNCVFQTLRHYKNYIFLNFCLQQATLLDSFNNEYIKNDKFPVKFRKLNFKIFTLGRFFKSLCNLL